MRYDFCDRCGIKIPEGGLKYIVTISIIADNDNIVSEDITDDELDVLISEIEQSDPDMLERDVNQKLAFILCKKCKEKFTRHPFNSKDEGEGWRWELN
ncbi:MAG: hypothetical protein AABZ11_08875 [Nitrospinota bacterium]